MVDFKVLFEGMDVAEMKEALKTIASEGKEFIKDLDVAAKAEALVAAKASVKEGDVVTVRYKDGTISGEVIALRDKTFTILTGDVLNVKGEATKVARAYSLIV